jgi:hypothetical protein
MEDLQLGGLTLCNKICELLESKDGEIRHKNETNGKAQLRQSRTVIGCRTNDDDDFLFVRMRVLCLVCVVQTWMYLYCPIWLVCTPCTLL